MGLLFASYYVLPYQTHDVEKILAADIADIAGPGISAPTGAQKPLCGKTPTTRRARSLTGRSRSRPEALAIRRVQQGVTSEPFAPGFGFGYI